MRHGSGRFSGVVAGLTAGMVGVLALPVAALAQPDPSGIDFVTVGAPGNAPWAGNGTEGDMAIGRGSVGYEYRIGRTEVTTAQWAEFFNAAYDRPSSDWLPHLLPPDTWGAVSTTPNTPGGLRWRVPAGNEMRAVGDISWRMAAMYANWLHNDKSLSRAAFLNGAYDVSTFGLAPLGFTDQLTHNPGARFWIPTWDEWLKAAHYDPNKVNGDGTTGGWWTRPSGTDASIAYGPPGVRVRVGFPYGPDPNGPLAMANSGWTGADFPGQSPFNVLLGAYPETSSPFGLLDAAGGTREWTEEVLRTNDIWPTWRMLDGSAWSASPGFGDRLSFLSAGDFPNTATFDYGFRIASTIPASWSCIVVVIYGTLLSGRRTRNGGRHETCNRVRHVRGSWGGGRTVTRRRRRFTGPTPLQTARSFRKAKLPQKRISLSMLVKCRASAM